MTDTKEMTLEDFSGVNAEASDATPVDKIKGFEVSYDKLQADLNTEFLSLEAGYNTAKTKRIAAWKAYRFQPYGNEKDGESKMVDSTIYNAVEWMLPILLQPFIETENFVKVAPSTAEAKDILAAEVLRELLTVQVRERLPYYEILYDTMKSALVQGEAYIKVLWKDKDKKMGEPVGRPEVIAVPAAQIRYDWTSQSFAKSKVVTQEEELNRSTIKRTLGKSKKIMKDRLRKAIEQHGTDTPEGRLRDEKVEQPNHVGEHQTKSSKSQSLYTRREHWTEYDVHGTGVAVPILAVFINDQLVLVEENPYDFKRPPFVAAQDVRDPQGNPAFGHSSLLSDVQMFRTGVLRMLSNNLNSQQNGMYEMDMNNIDAIGRRLLEQAPSGQRVGIPVRKPGSINPLQPVPLAPHAMQAMEIMQEVAENRGGVTRYSQGLDSQGLNQTATGITQIMQRSDMRMWELAQRFAEMTLKPLVRMLISLNQQLLDNQALKLQFGIPAISELKSEAISPGQWLTLNREDIGGFFSVVIDIEIGADKQNRIDNLSQLLQFGSPFIGQGVPPEVISVVFVELAKAMGLPKVQAVMRNSYVGAGGVTAPNGIFEADIGGSTGVAQPPEIGGQPEEANGQQGLPPVGVAGLLDPGGQS